MKIKIKTLFRGMTGLFLLAFLLPVQAAPLNLPYLDIEPLINSNGTFVDYNWTGSGGTLTITGLNAGSGTGTFASGVLAGQNYTNTSSQIMSMPASVDAQISANPGGSTFDANTPYLLQANFDANGAFVSGAIRVDGYATTNSLFGGSAVHPDFTGLAGGVGSGTILTMELTDFGFSGVTTTSGTEEILLEWLGDINGGDLFDLGFNSGRGGAVGLGQIDWGTTGFSGTYLPGDNSFMTQSFSSCVGCDWDQNTFVPIPAAIWLFGSGLLGLLGVSSRKRR